MERNLKILSLLGIILTIFLANGVLADPSINSTNITAQGGNVTFIDLNLTGQQSNIWQGFYGTVTGGITLSDGNNNTFYDWTIVSAVGEVLATRNIIPDWTIINCTNQIEIYEEEERLSILNESTNSINNTFKNTAHPSFDVGGRLMENCRSTKTSNSTTEQAVFWNILLNSNSTNTVYTVIMENDVVGFNGDIVDFQLLVPVDTDTGQSTYQLYIELT